MKLRVFFLLAGLCFEMNCQEEMPSGLPDIMEPVQDDSVQGEAGAPVVCAPLYFNNEVQGGFNPPPGLIGPYDDSDNASSGSSEVTLLGWGTPDDGILHSIFFWASPTSASLDEIVSDATDPERWPLHYIVRSEPITFNSEQKGWLFILRLQNESSVRPPSVFVFMVRNGILFRLDLWSLGFYKSTKEEYILSIARTLCAE